MDLLKKAPTIIGPILLVYIFYRYIRIEDVIKIYVRASLPLLIVSCLFNTMLIMAKIHRLHFMLKRSFITLSLFNLARTYCTANFLGQISNFLVADVVNAGALIFQHEKRLRITNIFIFTRIFDTLSIMGLLLVFLSINSNILKGYISFNYKPALIISTSLCLLIVTLLLFKKKILSVWKDLQIIARNTLLATLSYSFIIYLCYCLSAIYDAKTLHLDVQTSFILLCYMMGSLITVAPISIAGIGTRDLLFIFMLNLVTVSSDMAVALSTLGFLFIPFLSLSIVYLLSLIGIRYENRADC